MIRVNYQSLHKTKYFQKFLSNKKTFKNSNSYNKYPIISGSPYENSNYLNTYRIFSANPCHLDDGNRLGQLPRYLGASQKGKDKIIINVNRSFVHKSIDGRLAYPEFNESGPSEYDLHS